MKNSTGLSIKALLIIILGLSLFSCAKEGSIIDPKTEIIFPEPSEVINTTLYGRVVNDNNQPIFGAQVTMQSGTSEKQIETDETGNFLFENIENKGHSAFLTVYYPDMFKAFRRFSVIPDKINYTEIQLNEKVNIGTLSGQEGGTLLHDSGASIDLPKNGIIDANGTSYSGDYEVFMAWIHPDAENLSQNMVGDLSGIDKTGAVMALATYGMLVVELLDSDGNELNLAEGHTAELKFPVPQSMLDKAPATIPLWSYDEAHGYWIEESYANLEEAYYVGQVSHFSSWNVDTKGEAIEISGSVTIRNRSSEINLSYYEIFVCSPSIGQRGGWLCDDGSFLFYNFPANETFTLKVKDYCGNIVYESEWGPFATDEILPQILLSGDTETKQIVIEGNAIDCNLDPVTDGLAKMDFGNRSYVFDLEDDGSFSFLVTVCDQFIGKLSIVNKSSLTQSEPITVTEIDTEFTFKDILVCEALDNYFHLNIEGFYETVETEGLSLGQPFTGASTEPICYSIGYHQPNDPNAYNFHFYFPLDYELNKVIDGYDRSTGAYFDKDDLGLYFSGTPANIEFLVTKMEFEQDFKKRFIEVEFNGYTEHNGIRYNINGSMRKTK